MFPRLENLNDILAILMDRRPPKKMIFDLSEDGTFYKTKIEIDVVDKSKEKVHKGYIECRTRPKFLEYSLVYDINDRESKIFTITIPDLEDDK